MGIILSSCSNDNQKNDLSDLNLKANVKSVLEISYGAQDNFGKIEKGERNREKGLDTYITFNSEGNFIEENDFKKSESSAESYLGINYQQLVSKKINKYDENGNWTGAKQYDSKGSLYQSWVAKYDDKGNRKEISSYDSEGKKIYNKKEKYDSKRNEIELSVYDSNGDLEDKLKSKFNKSNKKIEERSFKKHEELENIFIFKYDSEGNRIEYKMLSNTRELNLRGTKAFDNNRSVIESKTYTSSNKLVEDFKYVYEYDKKSNWIKQVVYNFGIPKYLIERKIEYFD